MRPHVREFLEKCAATLSFPEPIVEIGAFQVPGQEAIADLRPLFPGKKYIGCDMQPGIGVDRIENIHELKFADGEVGTFILADTLEHVADPIRGMNEVHRCLAENGVVIYTSVMHFNIHGYPNDYWRFTPEAFRELGRPFPTAAIFYAGPQNFPHTVCGVAAKKDYDASKIKALADVLATMKIPAPLHLQAEAAKLVQFFIDRTLAAQPPLPKIPKPQIPSGFGRFDGPGWYLVEGQWVEGWVFADDVAEVEIVADGTVIHRAKLNRKRPDLAKQHNFPEDRPVAFVDQVKLPARQTWVGPLEMRIVNSKGESTFVRRSAPGIVLGEIAIDPKIVLHSLDETA